MQVTALYKAILASLSCEVGDDDMISAIDANDNRIPFMIEGRRLVNPTKAILKAPRWADWIAFHPLSESVDKGESPVLKALRAQVVRQINTSIGVLMMSIMGLAVDKNSHSNMSPDQLGLLALISDADEKCLGNLTVALSGAKATSGNSAVSIFLKRKAELNGVSYRRAAIVSFPIAEELADPNAKTLFGVELRKKDKTTLLALLEWILPGCTTEAYSRGSNSDIAPYFDALMQAYLVVQNQLNAVAGRFTTLCPVLEHIRCDLTWGDDIGDLGQFIGQVPPLSGNEGVVAQAKEGAALQQREPAPSRKEAPAREPARDPIREDAAPRRLSQPPRDAIQDTLYRRDDRGDTGRGRASNLQEDELTAWSRLQSGARNGRRPLFGGRDDRDDRDSRGRGRDDGYRGRDDRGGGGWGRRDDRGRGRGRDDYDDRYGRGSSI